MKITRTFDVGSSEFSFNECFEKMTYDKSSCLGQTRRQIEHLFEWDACTGTYNETGIAQYSYNGYHVCKVDYKQGLLHKDGKTFKIVVSVCLSPES